MKCKTVITIAMLACIHHTIAMETIQNTVAHLKKVYEQKTGQHQSLAQPFLAHEQDDEEIHVATNNANTPNPAFLIVEPAKRHTCIETCKKIVSIVRDQTEKPREQLAALLQKPTIQRSLRSIQLALGLFAWGVYPTYALTDAESYSPLDWTFIWLGSCYGAQQIKSACYGFLDIRKQEQEEELGCISFTLAQDITKPQLLVVKNQQTANNYAQ